MSPARKARVWYPYVIYHVVQRGNRRSNIFREESDYEMYLMLMEKALKEYGCTLHAYCLMSNHYHLLIQSGDIPFWKFMKMLSQDYAMYFNKQYHYSGHLFGERYKSYVITDDAYYLQCSRYIHLNPCKANIVDDPKHYKWSSYSSIIGIADDNITSREKLLSYFKDHNPRRYQEYIEDYNRRHVLRQIPEKHMIEEDKSLGLFW